MKVIGLLVILFGGMLAYLVGWKCYRLGDFVQELANFTHLPLGSHTPGTAVTPAACPDFGLTSVASGTPTTDTSLSNGGVAG